MRTNNAAVGTDYNLPDFHPASSAVCYMPIMKYRREEKTE